MIKEMSYDELLAVTPDHLSEEFLTFLRENNPACVVKELEHWLIVENVKYHKKGGEDHWTAFYKKPFAKPNMITAEAWKEIFDWIPQNNKVVINRASDKTIARMHIHIIK